MALLGLAAVAVLVTEGVESPRTQLVLIMAVAAAACVLIAAALGADSATRREHEVNRAVFGPASGPATEEMRRRLGDLTLMVTRGRHDLLELSKSVRSGEGLPRRAGEVAHTGSSEPLVRLAQELQQAQNDAWNAVLDAAAADSTPGHGPEQRVEVFVSLARRMQSLSHRAIQGLDELENQVEDPDLLKALFRVDHLSTRMRRQAESLAVIGGAVSRRQWSRPVTMYEVLRSATAEVEQYNRVKVVPPVEGTLHGRAVADVIHLLAELIENATKFAPPQTQVLLRAEPVTAGLAIEVEDRGLGIPRDVRERLNNLLSDFERGDIDELLRDGRIGLVVVSSLARRHNVAVQLQTNLYGGTQAIVVVPKELVGGEQQDGEDEPGTRESAPVPDTDARAAVASAPPAAPMPPPAGTPVPVAQVAEPLEPLEPPAPVAPPPPAPPSGGNPYGPPRSDQGERPPLPQRQAQASLAPELRDAPVSQEEDADAAHNPGLMAAFQRGMRSGRGDEDSARDAEGTPLTDHH
ncbi:MAG: ATP-binding protein [Streptosporangiales bacterium]|nr:ATP-binding protein [Streptosporangiales bacterium]